MLKATEEGKRFLESERKKIRRKPITKMEKEIVEQCCDSAIDWYMSEGLTLAQATFQATVDRMMLLDGCACDDLDHPEIRQPYAETARKSAQWVFEQVAAFVRGNQG